MTIVTVVTHMCRPNYGRNFNVNLKYIHHQRNVLYFFLKEKRFRFKEKLKGFEVYLLKVSK